MDPALEEDACVDYYCKIMTCDDVLLLKKLFFKIPRAPSKARHYLQRHCRSVVELEEFFKENAHRFFVENGRVALYAEELEAAPQRAEKYFQRVLEEYEDVHVMTLKKEHLGNASGLIVNFITRFYPCGEFKRFFKSRPDVFAVDKENNVCLIEAQAVAFFQKRLKLYGREKLRFMDFRGHVAQASPQIQTYINKNYFADDFQIFLKNNSDVFVVSESGYVSLVPLR